MKKIECLTCHRKFHSRGIANHLKSHMKEKEESAKTSLLPAETQQAQTPVVDIRNREDRAYRRGINRVLQLVLQEMEYMD
jgi:hypothetical protein